VLICFAKASIYM